MGKDWKGLVYWFHPLQWSNNSPPGAVKHRHTYIVPSCPLIHPLFHLSFAITAYTHFTDQKREKQSFSLPEDEKREGGKNKRKKGGKKYKSLIIASVMMTVSLPLWKGSLRGTKLCSKCAAKCVPGHWLTAVSPTHGQNLDSLPNKFMPTYFSLSY